MKERNLTCIVCPRGCQMTVIFGEGDKIQEVKGNACPRGKTYAEAECTNPVRVVTSTVRCTDGSVVAVKTNKAVPKGKIFLVMSEINAHRADCGIKIGDVIIRGVAGTDADVVATANWGNE